MIDLKTLRNDIDCIDLQILKLLKARYQKTQLVGEYKAAKGMPAIDKSREKAQKAKFIQLSNECAINGKVVWRIFKTIIDDVVKNHIKIAKQKNER